MNSLILSCSNLVSVSICTKGIIPGKAYSTDLYFDPTVYSYIWALLQYSLQHNCTEALNIKNQTTPSPAYIRFHSVCWS